MGSRNESGAQHLGSGGGVERGGHGALTVVWGKNSSGAYIRLGYLTSYPGHTVGGVYGSVTKRQE
ncbi:hypothetical protein D3C75_443780 [compost metagenome]